MRVSYVRPAPENDPLAYRLAICLHCRFALDAELRDVNLLTLSRPEIKEHILAVERSTGLSTGALIHDAQLEEDDD